LLLATQEPGNVTGHIASRNGRSRYGRRVGSILIFADTVRTPELRHEVPHSVTDPFLYVEHDGSRYAVLRSLEVARMSEVPGIDPLPLEDFGLDELTAQGLDGEAVRLEIVARACRRLGVTDAVVPPAFPLSVADRLREQGIRLSVDHELFMDRRRAKSNYELAGIRRAMRAAEAGTRLVAERLRAAEPRDGMAFLDGEPLTCERLQSEVQVTFIEHGANADELIVAHGPQTCTGHHMGSGAIGWEEPITVDLWPRDRASACFCDMTRTFVAGPVSDELRTYHRLCKEALDRAVAAVRPGVTGDELHRIASEVFEAAGQPTRLSKRPGEVLLNGFFHGLGHGVGLEVHEPPHLDLGGEALVAGDVIAIEPGCYRQGYGGVRLEDLVLVTGDGAETITNLPYALEP
jgi:Xaa-Pro aminopeptidase